MFASSTGDGFDLRYAVFWALCYVLFDLERVVLTHYWFWPEVIGLALVLATLGLGTYWFIRKYFRRGLSIVLALPAVWGLDETLSSVGIDTVQRSFWLTYPYYASRVEPGKPQVFEWGEDGLFLGGGWTYTLSYEPAGVGWENLVADATGETRNLIGLSGKQRNDSTDPLDCKFREMRQLGGNWYFKSESYGGGFSC